MKHPGDECKPLLCVQAYVGSGTGESLVQPKACLDANVFLYYSSPAPET